MTDARSRAVTLSPLSDSARLDLATSLLERRSATVAGWLETAIDLGALGMMPGTGATRELWEVLATIACHDLAAARAIEPHLDAIAILDQSGATVASATDASSGASGPARRSWGVYAAEGPDAPLSANESGSGWRLSGVKPWCSLAGTVDAALITARHPDGGRGLFAVELSDPAVHVDDTTWTARGLSEIPSGPVRFDAAPAVPIGEAGWYLSRPGFAWGGIGVAACWFGAAVGLGRTLHRAVAQHPGAHPLRLMHLGAVDEMLSAARLSLLHAAAEIDGGRANGPDGARLALRVRGVVARACEEMLWRIGHALGPAPLALDPEHAKRVADLGLYVRQHHAERDQETLGAALADAEAAPW